MHAAAWTALGCAFVGLSLQSDLVAQARPPWTLAPTTGPSARHSATMAYDIARMRTVLFGGSNGTYFGDTWEWNGGSWMSVPVVGPSARYSHTLAYDSQRRLTVLFGGYNGGYLGDTWEYDGLTWTLRNSGGPAPRQNHAMAYDTQRGRTVLFGGVDGTLTYSDTWLWDGVNWLPQLFANGPAARQSHALAHDPQRGFTVLFGGWNVNGRLADTWEWNGTSWTLRSGTGPTARHSHAMAADGIGNVIMVGGWDGTLLNDTWEWNGWTWSQVLVGGPPARYGHEVAFDSHRNQTVLFGGWLVTGVTFFGDTWTLDLPGPSARAYGTGCGSPTLGLAPEAASPPRRAAVARANLVNIPSPVAFMSVGWSKDWFGPFPLPLTLAGHGLPGCDLLQSAENPAQPVVITGPGTGSYSLFIPNLPALVGTDVYLQGWAPAPGANAASLIVSNGVHWRIG